MPISATARRERTQNSPCLNKQKAVLGPQQTFHSPKTCGQFFCKMVKPFDCKVAQSLTGCWHWAKSKRHKFPEPSAEAPFALGLGFRDLPSMAQSGCTCQLGCPVPAVNIAGMLQGEGSCQKFLEFKRALLLLIQHLPTYV